jgi:hypothetical protein
VWAVARCFLTRAGEWVRRVDRSIRGVVRVAQREVQLSL